MSLRVVLSRITKNRVLVNSFATQIWRIVSGPVSLIFIPTFLSSETQGFWYTFISISALSILADLGFSTIVLQFSAHEYAHLHFEEGVLCGQEDRLLRVISLFQFVRNWAVKVALVAFPVIFIVGVGVFLGKDRTLSWFWPWMLYLVASGLSFYFSVVGAFVQGLEQVATMQRVILVSSVVSSLVMFFLLFVGIGLYALPISALLSAGVTLVQLLLNYRQLLAQLAAKVEVVAQWGKEIFPLLGRYAVSWSSGFLIFQLFTPLAFQFYGPTEAGRVGISISLILAIFSMANVWITASTPHLNVLVSTRRWGELDRLFRKVMIRSIATFLSIGALALLVGILVYGKSRFLDQVISRFLGILPLVSLFFAWLIQVMVNGLATYLRAHKQEPFVVISMVSGLLVSLLTTFTVLSLTVDWIFIGFLVTNFCMSFWAFRIYSHRRKSWHADEDGIASATT